ncbi:hypothetical protein EW146_g3721 [Bondarzewia mesenterica]|uniref:Uncharacterized protein n=1 Tax=Bondarzewia mesenterica TaxID=1095465 RepID=A0A4S4LYY0_9AGAM|nr:hypothetical protein EW146_g3721 [Bondarzewia mesenterica]
MGGKERGIIQLTHHPLLRTITLIVSARTTTRPITALLDTMSYNNYNYSETPSPSDFAFHPSLDSYPNPDFYGQGYSSDSGYSSHTTFDSPAGPSSPFDDWGPSQPTEPHLPSIHQFPDYIPGLGEPVQQSSKAAASPPISEYGNAQCISVVIASKVLARGKGSEWQERVDAERRHGKQVARSTPMPAVGLTLAGHCLVVASTVILGGFCPVGNAVHASDR